MTRTTAQTASHEAFSVTAQPLHSNVLPLQAHDITGTLSVESVPEALAPWPDVYPSTHAAVRAQLTLDAERLTDLFNALTGYQSRAIGLRQMELSAEDVEELRRRREHPRAFPRLPLRRVRTENVDELD